MSGEQYKREYVDREVIDGKLLAALDDDEKAAIICGRDDLDMLIEALSSYPARGPEAEKLLAGLKDLKEGAFGD